MTLSMSRVIVCDAFDSPNSNTLNWYKDFPIMVKDIMSRLLCCRKLKLEFGCPLGLSLSVVVHRLHLLKTLFA